MRTVQAVIEELRGHGLRISTSRRMVVEAMFAAGGPVTAQRIATAGGPSMPALDLASVYRNLETLAELGVVRRLHAGHGAALYALAGRDARDYLVCDTCNAVRPIDPRALDPVRQLLRDTAGWRERFADYPIVGTCPDCAAARTPR